MNKGNQIRMRNDFSLIIDNSGHRKSGNFTDGVGKQYLQYCFLEKDTYGAKDLFFLNKSETLFGKIITDNVIGRYINS